jgi:hypothetical protein
VKPWYWEVLVLAIGWVLGLGTSYFRHWVQQHFEKRRRSETLKVAFRGEINALRSALAADSRAAVAAWEHRNTIKDYKLAYPRRIYEAHAAAIGDLRQSVLVGHISQLYSTLERAQDIGRRIEANTYGGDGLRDFAVLMVAAFHQALILDMRLTEQTKHLIELEWSVKVSEADAADRNFSVEALKKLEQAEAKP